MLTVVNPTVDQIIPPYQGPLKGLSGMFWTYLGHFESMMGTVSFYDLKHVIHFGTFWNNFRFLTLLGISWVLLYVFIFDYFFVNKNIHMITIEEAWGEILLRLRKLRTREKGLTLLNRKVIPDLWLDVWHLGFFRWDCWGCLKTNGARFGGFLVRFLVVFHVVLQDFGEVCYGIFGGICSAMVSLGRISFLHNIVCSVPARSSQRRTGTRPALYRLFRRIHGRQGDAQSKWQQHTAFQTLQHLQVCLGASLVFVSEKTNKPNTFFLFFCWWSFWCQEDEFGKTYFFETFVRLVLIRNTSKRKTKKTKKDKIVWPSK